MINLKDINISLTERLDEMTGSKRRSYIVLQRLAGRTYQDIGKDLNCSRQAVHRHVQVLKDIAPEIGKLASRRWG